MKLDQPSRPSTRKTVTVAVGAGVLLLAGSIGFALRGPDAWLGAAPADADRFDDSPVGAPLEPLSDEYIEARSRKARGAGVRPPSAQLVPGDPAQVIAPSASPGHADYPRAAWCSLETSTMLPGETRTCRFKATRAGGWNFNRDGSDPRSVGGFDWASAHVTVTRGKTVMTYEPTFTYGEGGPARPGDPSSWNSTVTYDGCADDIIVRGDLVEVELSTGSMDVDFGVEVGVGHKWDCDHAGD